MTNKKFILAIVLASMTSLATANKVKSEDPFVKEWQNFDGVNLYKLTISKSPAPGQTYSINYTFSGGSSSTDMCTATSNISFECLTGEHVVRDDIKHSVTITTRYYDTYVFYDPNYMPGTDKILGNWRWEYKGKTFDSIYTISVMRGKGDSEYNVVTTYSDTTGNICSGDNPIIYHLLSKTSDGSEIFSDGKEYGAYKFKYDPIKNQIVNPDINENFLVGPCVEIMAVKGREPIFTKQ